MKINYLIGVAGFSALVQLASAQSSSYYSSYSDINFSTGADVVTSQDPNNAGGQYNNTIVPTSTGDGTNYDPDTYGDEYTSSYTGLVNQVDNFASSASAATSGSASQFWGYNHFTDFTNNGSVVEYVTLTEVVEQYIDASATGTEYSLSSAYAGMQVYQGSNPIAYFTNTIDSNGVMTSDYTNFAGGFVSDDHYYGTGTLAFSLAPGETVDVQTWASGSTEVQPAPEPITIGLGIAAIGAVMRKRRKSAV